MRGATNPHFAHVHAWRSERNPHARAPKAVIAFVSFRNHVAAIHEESPIAGHADVHAHTALTKPGFLKVELPSATAKDVRSNMRLLKWPAENKTSRRAVNQPMIGVLAVSVRGET